MVVSSRSLETVYYSKSVRMTFGSLSIAYLWSVYTCVYVDLARVTSAPRPSCFSACNIESWDGPGEEAKLGGSVYS